MNPYSSDQSDSAENTDNLQDQIMPQLPGAESQEFLAGPQTLNGPLLDYVTMDRDHEVVPDWNWAACLQMPLDGLV